MHRGSKHLLSLFLSMEHRIVINIISAASIDCLLTHEPSHSRGAPDVLEPLIFGAQKFSRYNAWKKFVRATRPTGTCMR